MTHISLCVKIYQKNNSRSHYWTRFKSNRNFKVKCISFLVFHVHIVQKSALETVKPHMINKHFFVAENDDTKKRMYSCVLVVGGGLMFPMAQSWLQYLIWTQMPGAFRLQLETQDIITNPKVNRRLWRSSLCFLDFTANSDWYAITSSLLTDSEIKINNVQQTVTV